MGDEGREDRGGAREGYDFNGSLAVLSACLWVSHHTITGAGIVKMKESLEKLLIGHEDTSRQQQHQAVTAVGLTA